MTEHIYDVVIIGGGPAGYTAALYAVRAGFETLVIEKLAAGGQMTQTLKIDNYPGFNEGIDGFTLGFKMQNGAERFGAKTLNAEVIEVNLKEKIKSIETSDGTVFTKAVIIATGAKHRHLGIDNENELIGKGLGYCAACDGMFFKDKTVAVVGGGNSAAADALLLSKICKKVYLIHRRNTLRATKIYHEPLLKADNVEFLWNSTVDSISFTDRVNGVIIKNSLSDAKTKIDCDGLFISIGRAPETSLFKGQVDIDNFGYIVADESTRTNIPGVFAAGDVRTKSVRQIVTAVSDGATAVHYMEQYLAENK